MQAMKERGIPVTHVVYPDEGHLTFFHLQNNISFYAIAGAKPRLHSGGRSEPIEGALEGSERGDPRGCGSGSGSGGRAGASLSLGGLGAGATSNLGIKTMAPARR
ncbi:MAG: hypothetical protein R3E12_02150 [Candidatus Eisenbacteria bacterium]